MTVVHDASSKNAILGITGAGMLTLKVWWVGRWRAECKGEEGIIVENEWKEGICVYICVCRRVYGILFFFLFLFIYLIFFFFLEPYPSWK